MGRMKSLLNKSTDHFTISTIIILICCSPLFFIIMKHFYAEDLDELIIFRSDEFVADHLPQFSVNEISIWNNYNEDMCIVSADEATNLSIKDMHHVVQKPFFNKAEGHEVDYRVFSRNIEIEGKPYILLSRIAMIEDKDLIRTLAGQYGILFLVLFVCMFVVQRIMSKRLWKPFYNSLSKVEKFDLERGNIPKFRNTQVKEFDRLNTILTNLIDNNVRVYNQQKEFVQNASHELQTPLAIFQSKLDVFFQDPNLTKEQVETIHSLYDILSRMTRLNKNLLLLARIDNNQFNETENIDFNKILLKQLDNLKPLAESENIAITTHISEHIFLKANKILLESLINNLVVNAISHNISNGNARIVITLNSDFFAIQNTSDTLPLDKEKIFRRFSRTSENRKGNGMGLSIAYQICKLHNWQLNYKYSDSMHCFVIYFNN